MYRLSTRPKNRVGSDETWNKSEQALAQALDEVGVDWIELKGEGAFYGPKIEYSLKDSLGRVWQCGTIQVDFNMPYRLGAEFVAEDNTRQTPVLLHRAIVGSLERFIGILIENFGGALPLWLSPVQVGVASITSDQVEYASMISEKLRESEIRVTEDLRNEKISYKIRELSLRKIPYILIIGNEEKTICCVPSSKIGVENGVNLLCNTISNNNNEILDASECLIRTKNVPSAHLGGPRDQKTHLDSIEIKNSEKFQSKKILLIDDVASTCSTLEACIEKIKSTKPLEIETLVLGRNLLI